MVRRRDIFYRKVKAKCNRKKITKAAQVWEIGGNLLTGTLEKYREIKEKEKNG